MSIFQKIIDRQLPATIVFETEHVMAVRDINPQAPVHVVIFPKRLIPRVAKTVDADAETLGRLFLAARDIARALGLEERGYRLVVNNGDDAGQTVEHIHVHLIGGREMGWPPG